MDKKWIAIIILLLLVFILLVSFILFSIHIYARIDQVEKEADNLGVSLDLQEKSIKSLEDFQTQTEAFFSNEVFIDIQSLGYGNTFYLWSVDGQETGFLKELVSKENIPNKISLIRLSDGEEVFSLAVNKDKIMAGDKISVYTLSQEEFEKMRSEPTIESGIYSGVWIVATIRHLNGRFENSN